MATGCGRLTVIVTGSVASEFEKQMGYTHKEFLDNLPAAMKDQPYRVVNNRQVVIPIDQGQLTIHLGEQQVRNIASIVLPFMMVRFQFERVEENSRTVFYRKFQRSYQKGGG